MSPLFDLLLTFIDNDQYAKYFCSTCGTVADERLTKKLRLFSEISNVINAIKLWKSIEIRTPKRLNQDFYCYMTPLKMIHI